MGSANRGYSAHFFIDGDFIAHVIIDKYKVIFKLFYFNFCYSYFVIAGDFITDVIIDKYEKNKLFCYLIFVILLILLFLVILLLLLLLISLKLSFK